MQRRKKIRIGVAVRVRPYLKFEENKNLPDKLLKYDYQNQQIQ